MNQDISNGLLQLLHWELVYLNKCKFGNSHFGSYFGSYLHHELTSKCLSLSIQTSCSLVDWKRSAQFSSPGVFKPWPMGYIQHSTPCWCWLWGWKVWRPLPITLLCALPFPVHELDHILVLVTMYITGLSYHDERSCHEQALPWKRNLSVLRWDTLKVMMRWVKWNSASRSSRMLTCSTPEEWDKVKKTEKTYGGPQQMGILWFFGSLSEVHREKISNGGQVDEAPQVEDRQCWTIYPKR